MAFDTILTSTLFFSLLSTCSFWTVFTFFPFFRPFQFNVFVCFLSRTLCEWSNHHLKNYDTWISIESEWFSPISLPLPHAEMAAQKLSKPLTAAHPANHCASKYWSANISIPAPFSPAEIAELKQITSERRPKCNTCSCHCPLQLHAELAAQQLIISAM